MSPTDTAVLSARLRKAAALADVLDHAGALGPDVLLIDDNGRRAAEQLAGVAESSDDTWTMVRDILSAKHATRARFSADPFEGLT